MATADISQVGRSIWANTDFDRGLEKVAVLQDFLEDNADDLAGCCHGNAPAQLMPYAINVR